MSKCPICRTNENAPYHGHLLCFECEKIDWKKIGIDLWPEIKSARNPNPKVYHEKINKPDSHRVFLQIAHIFSTKSPDANTKHGCVLVKENRVISTGYNGFISGANDDILPNTREGGFKYKMVLHSEVNSIINAARNGISTQDSIAYITGEPCTECAKCLIQSGCTEWYVGNVKHQRSEEDEMLLKFFILHHNVKMTHL